MPPATRSRCRWSRTSTRTLSTSSRPSTTAEEPVVLPARFPNLLVNGSQGIAVGMATNIPPHNLGEVIDATVHLIDQLAQPDDLMRFVHGPDFPTGGFIMGRAGIVEAYRTGRGSVKMRAKATIEETARRGGGMGDRRHRAALPGSCIHRRAHPGAGRRRRARRHRRRQRQLGRRQDHLDRSASSDANANVVLNNLFKQTQLKSSFAVNMVALLTDAPHAQHRPGAPGYIAHQVEVITRRSQVRLEKARRDEDIQEGLLRA